MSADYTYNPRSLLYAIAPSGLNTASVESLISYFCRLAASHCISVTTMAETITQKMGNELRIDFVWRERKLSGIGPEAQSWSTALSAMTGINKLNQLTMSTWANVLTPRGLMAPSTGKWCPACFEDDLNAGRPPYFRLAWDIKAVTACVRHNLMLENTCPDCKQTGVRHKSAYVIPGWCTKCGAFLHKPESPKPADPSSIWVAEQINKLLAMQASLTTPPNLEALHETIKTLVIEMSGGNGAAFAKRVKVAKSTVHCWTHGKTAISLDAALHVCDATGLSLDKLLTADLDQWEPQAKSPQLKLHMALGSRQRSKPERSLDWKSIRQQLRSYLTHPTPVSLAEAARELKIDASYLYLNANKEARQLSSRWLNHVTTQAAQKRQKAREKVLRASQQLLSEGRAVNMREIQKILLPEDLKAAKHLFDMLAEIKEALHSDAG